MSKPLTVKVSISSESSFNIDLGWDGCNDANFIVQIMLQAGKTLGEELKKHGVPANVIKSAIKKMEMLELQEAVQAKGR